MLSELEHSVAELRRISELYATENQNLQAIIQKSEARAQAMQKQMKQLVVRIQNLDQTYNYRRQSDQKLLSMTTEELVELRSTGADQNVRLTEIETMLAIHDKKFTEIDGMRESIYTTIRTLQGARLKVRGKRKREKKRFLKNAAWRHDSYDTLQRI
jgi:chromosome segregation ATPase